METITKAVKVDPTNHKVRGEYERIKEQLGPRADTTKETFQHVFKKAIYSDEAARWPRGAGVAVELVYAAVCWLLLSTLGAQIWFFPLEYMDVTGYEVLVLSVFAPLLLAVPRVNRLFQSQLWHFAASVGLVVAFKLPRLLPRVVVLAVSSALSLLCVGARWSFTGPWLGLGGALVALDRLVHLSRPSLWHLPEASFALLFVAGSACYLGTTGSSHTSAPAPVTRPFSVAASVGLGSLLFLHQWLLLQCGALSRLFALPVFPLGLLVFVASLLGHAAPPLAPVRLGAASAVLMLAACLLSHAMATPPALVLAGLLLLLSFVLAAMWRSVAYKAFERPPAATLGAAILVYLLHFLASIWTVAYNFVPFGGSLMREHTRTHLVVAALLAGLPLLLRARGGATDKVGAALKLAKERALEQRQQARVIVLVLLLVLAPVAVLQLRTHLSVGLRAAKQARSDAGEVRAMIWAVHFGYDNFGRNSFDEIERIVRSNNVNVVGLLESDLTRVFTDNWDVVHFLSQRLGNICFLFVES